MVKADGTVKRETRYIAVFCICLSVAMQVAFVAVKKWDYTVILGNMLSFIVTVLNFYFMGISVSKALSSDEQGARQIMRSSQMMRNFGIFVAVALGAVLPYFNTAATIIPIFFPRIAIAFRPLFYKKEVKDK